MIELLPLILASASPRRRMLLRSAGVTVYAVIPPGIDEHRAPDEPPVRYARRLASAKAAAVADKADCPANSWVLAADTVVHLSDAIYEKPIDDAHAIRMLGELSGRWHQVTTAWCLHFRAPDGETPTKSRRSHRTSRVRFRILSAGEIARYVATGEGRDKAGSYAIQGRGVALVERVVGSTTNVVGLPMVQVLRTLRGLGLTPEPN